MSLATRGRSRRWTSYISTEAAFEPVSRSICRLAFATSPKNGNLAARVGDIVAAFGGELTGGFEAAARKRGVLRDVSGAKATHATQAELVASLAAMQFARDEVLVISPATAYVTCGDNRCSFEIYYESILYDAKARKPMWFAKHNVTVVRNLADRGAAKIEFDAPEAVDSYWNAVFGSLRSDKLID